MPAGGTPMAFLTVYLHERLMSFSFSGGCHAPVAPLNPPLSSAQLSFMLQINFAFIAFPAFAYKVKICETRPHMYVCAYFVSAIGRIELCDIIIALLLSPFQIR